MEESRVGFKIETGAEDVDIKHEPLEPYVEYPVSLCDYIVSCFLENTQKQIALCFLNFLKLLSICKNQFIIH